MRNVSQIHKTLTGNKRGQLRDWLEAEKADYIRRNSTLDFLTWINEKYPEDVKSIDVVEVKEMINKAEGDTPTSKVPKIKKFFLSMPPSVTYGVGAVALGLVLYVGYRVISSNKK